jgi:hypothetical protein
MERLQNVHRDVISGGLLVLLGIGIAFQAARYDVGTLTHMGPGYFPLALGVILTLLGVILSGSAISRQPARKKAARPEWRAWSLICISLLAFLGLTERFGLVPGTFAIVCISALADRNNTLRSAALLAAAMVVVAVVVFRWGLQIQLPLLRWS